MLSQRRSLGKHLAAIFAGQVFRFSVLVVHVFSANVSVSSRVTTKLAGPNQGGTAALLVKVTSLHHEGQHTCKRHQKTITTVLLLVADLIVSVFSQLDILDLLYTVLLVLMHAGRV